MSSVCSSKMLDDTMEEDDDKDDTKRKTRNLSEKRRRDQFSTLVNELGTMVSTNNRKMDKSTVLRATIAFLKSHNEAVVRNKAHEISEDFKPNFISNDEYLHILLDALDGFIITFSSSGNILYTSYSIGSLLGYLQTDLKNASMYDLVIEEDHQVLFDILRSPFMNSCAKFSGYQAGDNEICFECRLKRDDSFRKTNSFEKVQFFGHYRMEKEISQGGISSSTDPFNICLAQDEPGWVFVCEGLLQNSLLLRELAICELAGSEFTSRHSLEWKFIYLDQRAPPIIGYLPFEVLGTSGYEYYHIDDLENISSCHEKLMQKGEGTTCLYRFLTKGQQWIWLQTRSYITYHQWNSKPEFVVCTNRVVGYPEVIKQLKIEETTNIINETENIVSKNLLQTEASQSELTNCSLSNTLWPIKSPQVYQDIVSQSSPSRPLPCKQAQPSTSLKRDRESEAASISVDSPGSLRSIQTNHSNVSSQRPLSNISKYHPTPSMLAVDNSPQILNQANQAPLFVEPQYVDNVPTPTGYSNQQVEANMQIPDISAQMSTHYQLQRKQEQLQQVIQQQQEELRRVSEQLAAVSYGLIPAESEYNPLSIPYSMAGTVSSTTNCLPSTDQYLQQILPQEDLTLNHDQYQSIPYDDQYGMGFLVYQDQTGMGDLTSYQMATQLLFDDASGDPGIT